MSWVGWLILAALFFYLPVLAARGLVEFWHWFLDNFTDSDLPRRRPEDTERRQRRRKSREPGARDLRESASHTVRSPAKPSMASRFHPLAPLAHLARKLVAGKRFDYWVACALEESNPAKKVKFCAKAVELNPTYVPGWGLMGTTLLELQRYAEAIDAFDKVIQLAPSALAWYRKGLCCYHLKRLDEAIRCFNKTLDTCANNDRALSDEAGRYKSLAQTELHASGAGNLASPG
jgi:tetratricopeptide (TPR) repeat protein